MQQEISLHLTFQCYRSLQHCSAAVRLGLLSIAVSHIGTIYSMAITHSPHAFSILVVSHEVSAAKPKPKIYKHAQHASTHADRIFFCDDLIANVDAARHAGWDAEHSSACQLS